METKSSRTLTLKFRLHDGLPYVASTTKTSQLTTGVPSNLKSPAQTIRVPPESSTRTCAAPKMCSALIKLIFSSLYFKTLPSVSYTHLRAHETDSYLVCRLLLE